MGQHLILSHICSINNPNNKKKLRNILYFWPKRLVGFAYVLVVVVKVSCGSVGGVGDQFSFSILVEFRRVVPIVCQSNRKGVSLVSSI